MTTAQKSLTLVLGGARSGKSDYAEAAALKLARYDGVLAYLATAEPFDDEMRARISRHQSRRNARFETVETPLDITTAINGFGANDTVLIDSIGVWITNHMMAKSNIPDVINTAIACLVAAPCSIVLVSDEVGMGLVPEGAMSRGFRDHIGMMNQSVAAVADTVAFIIAGLPLIIKPE
ncbi:MAG: bifunctional adenosylcobinamide kinase/adenosylcobinamide-phosphate guanylyltransferase [Candidatus Puniceispirillales bacterium WSBS_2018_MAG_OTU23]